MDSYVTAGCKSLLNTLVNWLFSSCLDQILAITKVFWLANMRSVALKLINRNLIGKQIFNFLSFVQELEKSDGEVKVDYDDFVTKLSEMRSEQNSPTKLLERSSSVCSQAPKRWVTRVSWISYLVVRVWRSDSNHNLAGRPTGRNLWHQQPMFQRQHHHKWMHPLCRARPLGRGKKSAIRLIDSWTPLKPKSPSVVLL